MAIAVAKRARVYRGSPAPERASQRRTQLVAAGRKLFGKSGYAAVTVRSVCVEAGLTERYFYESFSNREELLAAVYLACVGDLQEAVNGAIVDAERLELRVRAGLG